MIRHFICLAIVACAAPAWAGDETGFISLFDGKTLSGWEGNLAVFHVRDGAIVGGSLAAPVARNEFLCSREQYGDFDLRLKFRLLGGDNANAGVQFRTRRIPNHHEVKGYQADAGQSYWGALYDESRRGKILAQPKADRVRETLKRDDWNDYRIRCAGPRIQIWLNDTQTVDYTERDANIDRTGVIGLQIHGGPPSEAWYKDIRIKKLQ